MRMFRSNPDEHFTILPNATLQDDRLSLVALGILCQLISRPDGWVVTADSLWKQKKRLHGKKTGQGREAIRAAFAELEELGYLIRRKTRGEGGACITVTELYDTPGHRDEPTVRGTAADAQAGNGTSREDDSDRGTESRASVHQASVSRASGNLASIERTDVQRTELQSTEDKHSTSLADARAAAANASARDRESRLNELYDAVECLDDTTLRNALLTFENRRPRIYRRCRIRTADQYNDKDRSILKSEDGSRRADTLSYKYALRHYYETADEWPAWLIRPLLKPVRLKSVS